MQTVIRVLQIKKRNKSIKKKTYNYLINLVLDGRNKINNNTYASEIN